jgi:hypothetical protein
MKNKGIQLADSSLGLQSIDLKIDVLRDEIGMITQGLVVGEILNQNQAVILIANPGEFPFNPKLGVAIDELLLDDDYLKFKHRIREHLVKDGMIVKSIDFSSVTPLKIDASYE